MLATATQINKQTSKAGNEMLVFHMQLLDQPNRTVKIYGVLSHKWVVDLLESLGETADSICERDLSGSLHQITQDVNGFWRI